MTASHSSFPDPGDQRRTYVLDTSVLLSDPWAMSRFAEHAVVLPLVVMTSFPVEALLGQLRLAEALWALLWTLLLLALSRWTFRRALANYTSASS